MAFAEKYVTSDAGGGGDGSSGSPWTLSEAFVSGRAGDRINVKAGTYTRTATDTPDALFVGTAEKPIVVRGYSSSIGDLKRQGRSSENGELDTTNFPTIAYNDTFYLNASFNNYIIYESLRITGTRAGRLCTLSGSRSVARNLYVENNSTDAAAVGLYCHTAISSDVNMGGGSGTKCAIECPGYGCRVLASRVIAAPATGILCTATAQAIIDTVIVSPGGDAVLFDSTSTTDYPPLLWNVTIYCAGYAGYAQGNRAYSYPAIIGNSIIAGCVTGIISDYNVTGSLPIVLTNNVMKNATEVTGFDGDADNGWENATNWYRQVATTTTSEFVNAAGGDFNLASDAKSIEGGVLPYSDCGALQKESGSGGHPFYGDRSGGLR